MKKIARLLFMVLMLCTMLTVFAVPGFAEYAPKEVAPKNDPGFAEYAPKEVVPKNNKIVIASDENYIISGNYTVDTFTIGNASHSNITLTIAQGASVTVKDIFYNWGTINVCGTLKISGKEVSQTNMGTIRVVCCDGKGGRMVGAVSGTVFTQNAHNFVDGKCVCGTYECENTGNHNWANGVCSVCNKPCDHTWDVATGKCTVCELVCTHEYDKCDICGKVTAENASFNTGSALSEGSLMIIVGVAALALGLVGGFFLCNVIGKKKKKPALAVDGEESAEN